MALYSIHFLESMMLPPIIYSYFASDESHLGMILNKTLDTIVKNMKDYFVDIAKAKRKTRFREIRNIEIRRNRK